MIKSNDISNNPRPCWLDFYLGTRSLGDKEVKELSASTTRSSGVFRKVCQEMTGSKQQQEKETVSMRNVIMAYFSVKSSYTFFLISDKSASHHQLAVNSIHRAFRDVNAMVCHFN